MKTLRQLADEADDPGAHFDLAVAFLAAGQLPDAEREMNLGFGGLSREAPRYQEILRPPVLDELATLDEYCERARKDAGCRQLVRQMQDRSVVREDGQPHPGRKIEGRVDIAKVTPLDVQWTFALAGGFDPARDSVYTRVYRLEADGMPYTLDLHRLEPRAIAPDVAPGDPMPRYRVRQSFVMRSFCNDAYSFRGEMYVNGQRLGQASWTAEGGPGKGEAAGHGHGPVPRVESRAVPPRGLGTSGTRADPVSAPAPTTSPEGARGSSAGSSPRPAPPRCSSSTSTRSPRP